MAHLYFCTRSVRWLKEASFLRVESYLRPLKSLLSHNLYDFPSSCIDPLALLTIWCTNIMLTHEQPISNIEIVSDMEKEKGI